MARTRIIWAVFSARGVSLNIAVSQKTVDKRRYLIFDMNVAFPMMAKDRGLLQRLTQGHILKGKAVILSEIERGAIPL